MIGQKNTNPLRSSREDLERRGYIDHMDLSFYTKCLQDNIERLHDQAPLTRSIGAKLLIPHLNENATIDKLLLQLDKEKALYTRLEICATLSTGNSNCALKMMKYLGKIGNNQYKETPAGVSKKKSFPLPRDIIARTIGRMDASVLPTLLKAMDTCTLSQSRELVDGIGYLCFNQSINKKYVFLTLQPFYLASEDVLLRWKLVCVFGQLKPYSEECLLEASKSKDPIIQLEALRGLNLKTV